MTNTIILAIALTIAGEAGGDCLAAKRGVASVIFQEAKATGRPLIEVASNPKRYCCLRKGQQKLIQIFQIPDGKKWKDCVRIAQELEQGTFRPTIKATHFCGEFEDPWWSRHMKELPQIGKTRFFVGR